MRTKATVSFFLFICLSWLFPNIAGAQCTSPLNTIMDADNGQDGIMFNVSSPTGIIIDSVWTNFQPGGINQVAVFSREGTFVGHTGSSSGWDLIDSAFNVVSPGINLYTSFPMDLGIPVPAGDTVGLYLTRVTTVFTSPYMRYTNDPNGSFLPAPPTDSIYTSNADAEISMAVGIDYPFAQTFGVRIWNGRLFYHCCPPTDSIAGEISGDTLGYYGDTLTYSIPWDSHAVSYQWSISGGDIIVSGQGDSAIQLVIGPNSIGGTICVELFDSCNYSNPKCFTYGICEPPMNPTSISGDTSVYFGDTVTYSIPSIGIDSTTWWIVNSSDSIVWLVGDSTAVVIVGDSSNGGQICVTNTNGCTTSDTTCQSYTICTPPFIESGIIGPSEVCPNDTVEFSLSNNASFFHWTSSGVDSILTGQNDSSILILIDSNAGGGSVCVSIEDECTWSQEQCNFYSVYSAAPISVSGPDTVSFGDTVWFFSSTDSIHNVYEWGYPINSSFVSGNIDSIQLAFGSISGKVCLTVEDICGIIDTACHLVVAADTTVGVEEHSLDRIKVFPNPSNGSFRIEGHSSPLVVELYEASGKLVWKKRIGVYQEVLNPPINSGLYFLHLKVQGNRRVEKLLILD